MKPRIAPALAAVFLVLAAFHARAGDTPDARIAELKAKMEAMAEEHAMDILGEQPDDKAMADAALVIGAFIELGMIGDPDPVRAAPYFKIAADRGCAEAECALGNLFASGAAGARGRMDKNVRKAVEHYERAAAAGSIKAMLELGNIYSDGADGVEADAKKALSLYLDAARRGDETALAKLDPVMAKAKEWEAARPGRKANFPTSPESVIIPELVDQAKTRNRELDRLASRVYQDLNKRLAASTRDSLEEK